MFCELVGRISAATRVSLDGNRIGHLYGGTYKMMMIWRNYCQREIKKYLLPGQVARVVGKGLRFYLKKLVSFLTS
jgi:hypothetical protein